MLELILIATLLLPLSWLIYECYKGHWIGCLLGIASLGMIAFVAHAWTMIGVGFQKNVDFGEASKTLALSIIVHLEAGETDHVIEELKRFAQDYNPNYENYPPYAEVVEETVSRLSH